MDPFSQRTNEMKMVMMNEFLRECFKYDFIIKTKEFQQTFDPSQQYLALNDHDSYLLLIIEDFKNI
jgi:hypothetical protein